MKRDFNALLSTFRNSIANYGYYVDFDKVYKNVENLKIELNLMNSLISSKNIVDEFKALVNKFPCVLKCIPLLLAVRYCELYCQDSNRGYTYKFNINKTDPFESMSIDQYCYFMEHTGLFNLMQNHIISNLIDYVTGIEVGMDSNARKNRGGHIMEKLVEDHIISAGFVKDVSYFAEMYIHEIVEKWGIDLSSISNKGKMEKRFDFVIKSPTMIYAIETNFYSDGGSKLNETARSYKTIAIETKDISGFTFIWITDGKGWRSAKHNLEETYDVMDNIYNIYDLEQNILEKIII